MDDSTASVPRIALESNLEQLRLKGAIFFRAEFTDGFAFESAPLAFAAALTPHADRMILFHIVAAGSCWVAVDDGVRHWATEGDVIVMPYGGRYVLGGRTPVDVATLLDLPRTPPWDDIPVVRQGGGGERTDVVCGYLHSEHPLFDPSMKALPPVFVVRLPDGPAASWVHASVAYALEATTPSNRSPTVLETRLPELVLMEVLRVHLSAAPSSSRGWLAALHDWRHPLLRGQLPATARARYLDVMADSERLLTLVESFPRTVAHHDAQWSNLFRADPSGARCGTVAIDWSFLGSAPVGQDLGTHLSGNICNWGIDPHDSAAHDATATAAYLQGLRDFGWAGDERQVVLTRAIVVALQMSTFLAADLSWLCEEMVDDEPDDEQSPPWPEALARRHGLTVDEALTAWATGFDYVLSLGEEARA